MANTWTLRDVAQFFLNEYPKGLICPICNFSMGGHLRTCPTVRLGLAYASPHDAKKEPTND